MKKLFISQPMNGKTDEEILEVRKKAVESAERELGEKVEVIDSFFQNAPADASPLWFLAQSLELLATADVAYFAVGWETARGCIIENQCALRYNIPLVIEAPSEAAMFTFKRAYEALKNGADIKRKHWKGFWRKEGDTIVMYCKDGRKLKITESEDIFFTLDGMMAEDWEIVDGNNITDLDVTTFTFGEAIRRLKNGQKVARKGWNGKGQYVELATGISYVNACNEVVNCEHAAIGNKAIAFVGTSGVQMGWLASQADMLSEDWYIVE